MTATDELRKLLDGRGVEWRAPTGTLLADEDTGMTYWGHAWKGRSFVAMEVGGGLRVDPLTPEQAVEATLGPDPCKIKPIEGFTRDGIYRESMLERDELIKSLHSLAEGLYTIASEMHAALRGGDQPPIGYYGACLQSARDKMRELGFGEVDG